MFAFICFLRLFAGFGLLERVWVCKLGNPNALVPYCTPKLTHNTLQVSQPRATYIPPLQVTGTRVGVGSLMVVCALWLCCVLCCDVAWCGGDVCALWPWVRVPCGCGQLCGCAQHPPPWFCHVLWPSCATFVVMIGSAIHHAATSTPSKRAGQPLAPGTSSTCSTYTACVPGDWAHYTPWRMNVYLDLRCVHCR